MLRTTQRFVLLQDTVLSEHSHLYCEHEPVNRVDPSGRIGILAGVIIAVVAVISLTGCGHNDFTGPSTKPPDPTGTDPAPWPGPGSDFPSPYPPRQSFSIEPLVIWKSGLVWW